MADDTNGHSPSNTSNGKSNVIQFPGLTAADMPPSKVLEGVIKEIDNIEELVVVSMTKDGNFMAWSSSGYLPDICWLLSQAQRRYELEGLGE